MTYIYGFIKLCPFFEVTCICSPEYDILEYALLSVDGKIAEGSQFGLMRPRSAQRREACSLPQTEPPLANLLVNMALLIMVSRWRTFC